MHERGHLQEHAVRIRGHVSEVHSMKRLLIPLVGLIAVACSNSGTDTSNPPATTTTSTGATAPATTASNASGFAAVAQIAATNCMPCHSAQKHRGGWAADSYADVMKPGDDGPVVKAGDPDNSLIIKVLHGPVDNPKIPAMPQGKPALAAADIQKISDWIKAGAKES